MRSLTSRWRHRNSRDWPRPEEQALLDGEGSKVPMARTGEPAEIAAAALFLASDQSSFMTGSQIFVDGGAEQI